MKKRILIAVAAVCIAGGGVALFAGNVSKVEPRGTVPDPNCKTRPENNDGYCIGDSIHFYCEPDGDYNARKNCALRPQ